MERRKFISDSAKYMALTIAGTSLLNNKLLGADFNQPNKSLKNIGIEKEMTNPTMYENVSTTVLVKGKAVKVHGICTGTVAVKTNFRTKKGFGELAKLNILLDKHFTEYLPIWVWIIEHPDGLIVIDTGEIEAIKNLDKYLSKESNYNRYTFKQAAKFDISVQDELNFQFEKINLKLEEVKLVALTHLHLDHTDGLKFFPKAEIIVGDYEFKNPYTNMPSTYPSWFNPNKVNYKENQINVFEKAYPINNDLFYVPTPGHTHGHSSIIFKTDEFDIFFAGDTSYNQEQVIKGELAGVNADFKKSKLTYKNILAYATNRKIIYLPTHDENAGKRLLNKSFIL